VSAVLEAQEPTARYLNSVQPALVQQFGLLATASGGIVRLRELVLALAIEGKLVPQDPCDAHAGALLARVQARRKQLVAEGTIKAGKSEGPSLHQDSPFVVPSGWEWISAADVCVVITDGDHQAPPKADSGVPFLVIGDVRDGAVGLGSATRFVPREYFDALDWGKKPLQGDILYTTVGSLGIPVPVVQQQVFCFQRHIALLRPGLPELQAYLTLALQSRLAFDQAASGATGIAQKTVPLSVLRSLRLPLPPLAEQSRIVARVDELMRLCDALEAKGRLEVEQHARLLGTLLGTLTDSSTPEELAANWQRVAGHFDLLLDRPEAVDALEQTILQLAVRGLLVPQVSSDQPASSLLEQIRTSGEQKKAQGKKVGAVAPDVQPNEVPFEVPESWAWSRFGQVAEIASNLVSPGVYGSEWQVAPDCIEKGTGRLLAKRTVADADVKSANHRFHPGQIIYSKIRPSLSKAVIVDFAGLCSADMYPINSRISTQYLLLVILGRCFLDQVAAAENRVKMPKLNQEALTAFLVPVPPLAEQERIVARVADLRRLCTDLRQRLSRSSATQASLAEALIDYALAA